MRGLRRRSHYPPADHDLLATISLASRIGTAAEAPNWFDALAQRRTTRGPLATPQDAEAFDDLIPPAAPGVSFTVVEVPERDEIAELVAQGDHAQFADPRWRRELASWMHPRRHGDELAGLDLAGDVRPCAPSLQGTD